MTKLILAGEPKSTQHVYKMTCRGKFATMYMSKEGKSIKEDYQWQIKNQYKGKPMEGELSIVVDFYFGTKRKCDIDNFSKLLFDSMNGMVWLDDSQIEQAFFTKYYDKDYPRIEIQINNV